MIRNKFGINVDEGLALVTPEDFELLYVEKDLDKKKHLSDWLNNKTTPLYIGGQIGTGKTKFINSVFLKEKIRPDCVFHFDSRATNASPLDMWYILFTELMTIMLKSKITEAIPEDFLNLFSTYKDIDELRKRLVFNFIDADSIGLRRKFLSLLDNYEAALAAILKSSVEAFESKNQRPMILFASGLDKYDYDSVASFSLRDVLTVLKKHKTLFECNVYQLFAERSKKDFTGETIVLTASSREFMEKLLQKRLGVYSQTYTKAIKDIAHYSGGIPRQAIRLLDYFLAYSKPERKDNEAISKPESKYNEVISKAVSRYNRDIFAFSPRPSVELLSNINRTQELVANLLLLPGDKDTANRAVLNNWIILGRHKMDSIWTARINPIVLHSLLDFAEESEEPETEFLSNYADATGMSDYGLDIPFNSEDWKYYLNEQFEKDYPIHVEEILKIISSALLTRNRQDRIIILYKNKEIATAVRFYLQAKSNSYEHQTWKHFSIKAVTTPSPFRYIIEVLEQEQVNVFSFDYEQKLPDEDVKLLNLRRDYFLDKQLIWWIPKEDFKIYIKHWTQLRQLFQIVEIEDDLARFISDEEIQSDLEFMEEIAGEDEPSTTEYVRCLKSLLQHLKEYKDGR